jgi:hypothetical protein
MEVGARSNPEPDSATKIVLYGLLDYFFPVDIEPSVLELTSTVTTFFTGGPPGSS